MTGRIALALAGLVIAGAATEFPAVRAPGRCAPAPGAADQALSPSRSLYCMDLIPAGRFAGGGTIELRRVSTSPFTVSVDAEGRPLSELHFVLDHLPDPASLGPYSAYVAWATTSDFQREVRLGEVRNGQSEGGTVGFDRYIITITAERSPRATRRDGRVVLTATSPSWLLQPHDDITYWQGAATPHVHGGADGSGWVAPPMDPRVPLMAPGMDGLKPVVAPWLPSAAEGARVPMPAPRQVVALRDGESLALSAGLIRRSLAGRTSTAYGFNGRSPGPLIRMTQGSTIVVNFTNDLDQPTSIHWHGVRLDNRSDGTPHVTQELVPPGGRFRYVVHAPDAGIYWYHPHQREDAQQNLGLYGNLLVEAKAAPRTGDATREEFLVLGDALLDADGAPVPYGVDAATHALMGRFGNVLLVNGARDYTLRVARGEVVRFFLTNVS